MSIRSSLHGGQGHFTPSAVEGLDFHEAKVAGVNADGRPDIVAKPDNYESSRIDVFLNEGR